MIQTKSIQFYSCIMLLIKSAKRYIQQFNFIEMSIKSDFESHSEQQVSLEDEDCFNTPGKKSMETKSSITLSETKMAMQQFTIINSNSHFKSQTQLEEEQKKEASASHWRKGNQHLELEQIELAIIQFKKSIQIKPFLTKGDYFAGLGCAQDRVGYHYESQLSWVQKVNSISPRNISPHDLLSLCISKTNKYQQQKEWYQKMIKTTNDYRLIYGLANLEYNNKKFTQAEIQYKRCIGLRPDFDQTYQKIANIYCFKLSKDDQATLWADKCLNINPDNVYATLIKALCIKSVQDRIKRLLEVLQSIKDYARPYNGLGNAYYNNGDYDQAIKMYRKSIQINARYEHPYYGLGSIYNQLSNFDQSIIWYKKCIEVNPLYDYPLYGLGIAYNNKNDTKNAIYWLERCIQVNPKYDCPYYALGNIYRASKKYQLALKYYKKSLECKSLDPLCFVNIALSYISLYDYENAYDYMLRAKQNIKQVDGLSKGNIDYIKQQINKYLNDDKSLQKNNKGILSFKQIISMSQNMRMFQLRFQGIFASV